MGSEMCIRDSPKTGQVVITGVTTSEQGTDASYEIGSRFGDFIVSIMQKLESKWLRFFQPQCHSLSGCARGESPLSNNRLQKLRELITNIVVGVEPYSALAQAIKKPRYLDT